MSQPLHSSLPGVLHECQGDCAAAASGHALGLMQERLALATPSKWEDALVMSVSVEGWLKVALLDGDEIIELWNHADLTATVQAGDPVALHAVYNVLAVGEAKHNALRAR